MSKDIPKPEFQSTMKKLRATKKASSELEEKEKLFYEFLTSLNLSREQKRLLKGNALQINEISFEYEK